MEEYKQAIIGLGAKFEELNLKAKTLMGLGKKDSEVTPQLKKIITSPPYD